MKLVFIHSHKFRKINGEYYSLGGLSNDVIERYLEHCDYVIILARVITEDDFKNNINYSKIINKKVKIIDYTRLSNKQIKEIITSADKVIARLPCVISLKGIRIAKKEKINYLIELVGCAWDSYWNHGLKGKIIAPWMFLFTKKAVKNAPRVLYVSNVFLQKRYPTNGEKIACSDVSLIEQTEKTLVKRQIKIKNMKKKNKIIVGTIGAVNVKYKGQQYVIKSVKQLKKEGYNIEYQIVGSGNNKYLKNIVRKANLNENIKFVGSLPHEEIFTWLDNLDIYIQPSNTEGLCRSIIEAMSRACPCIASNAGGNIELIDNKFIFKKKNLNDLKRKFKLLAEYENLNEQSKCNFKKSYEYLNSRLEKKRNEFYSNFLEGDKK